MSVGTRFVVSEMHVGMQELSFQLKDDFIELNKLLKVVGVCESSGAGKALVASEAESVVTLEDAVITVTGLSD